MMVAHVALLRAVNVAGHNRVRMADLLGMLAALGLAGGRSLLQSGNLVFQGDGRTGAELEALLEAETARRLAVHTEYMVRDAGQWQAIVDQNPFSAEAARDPGHLLVMVLKDAPDAKAVEALRAAIRGPERVEGGDRHLYVVYPAGVGRSKLTVSRIENILGRRGTGRNWNTVLKLAEMVRG
jgi:uncharacterized protein (DUF1697 family)